MALDVESFTNRRNDARWNRVSVGDIIERMTWNEPDKVALIATPDATVDPKYARVTYAQANSLVNQIANALLSLELPRASRIAMLCENSNEAWLTKIGIAKAGLVAAPINIMMAPDVIAEALLRVEAKLCIVDHGQWAQLAEPLGAVGIEPIVSIGAGPGDDLPSFDAFIAGQSDDEPDVTIHGDDIWEVLFTSGTTASPKAVMISHTYTYMTAYSHMLTMTRGLEHESDIRLGVFTPMVFHIGDHLCVFGPLVCGGTAIIGRKPDGHVMARACTQERVTCFFGGSPQFVESMIEAVNETPFAYDLNAMTIMFFGWAPLSPGTLAAFRRQCGPKLKVYELIGQTEAVACHRFFIDRHPEMYLREAPVINHVGKPSPIMAATIFSEKGEDLRHQPGVPGEAVYRSPAMFSGYYKDLGATEEAVRGDWFHSGDSFVYHDEEIRVMVDRYKDIVKSGGENVSSIRVEAVLQQHPSVARAAVVGVPDDRWGEAVTACVIATTGMEIDAEQIIAFARERLAGYETPKRIEVFDDFPTTVGGKILKYKLRAALAPA
ncbi:MAG: acyl-CoA synthetase (AMP-forming)/AMP-acid ligase II [Gammaproteobacteria bacterium]|jgi:acyl-CoA synthetase (AMP-forming)/AMP-acid ligase II